jgi:hypothetical protein
MRTFFKASRSLKMTSLRCFVASETNEPRQRVISQKIIGNNFLEYLPLETVQIFFQNIINFSTKIKSYFSNFFTYKKTRLYFGSRNIIM